MKEETEAERSCNGKRKPRLKLGLESRSVYLTTLLNCLIPIKNFVMLTIPTN